MKAAVFECFKHNFASTIHGFCPFCRLSAAEKERDAAIEGRRMWQGCAEEAARQRDTALRERDVYAGVCEEVRTALGCPDLPVEELAGKVGEVVEAAAEVLTHVEGSLPCRGWLKDNDRSRVALGRLAASIHPKEGETTCQK